MPASGKASYLPDEVCFRIGGARADLLIRPEPVADFDPIPAACIPYSGATRRDWPRSQIMRPLSATLASHCRLDQPLEPVCRSASKQRWM